MACLYIEMDSTSWISLGSSFQRDIDDGMKDLEWSSVLLAGTVRFVSCLRL